MSVLDELQQAVARIGEEVGPAVVGLGRGRGFGSGIVADDGVVLTNAHNLRRDEVTVTFHDGRQASGRVTAVDADGDIAVIATDTGGVRPVTWAGEAPPTVGTPVFALANPGGRGLRISFGLVSSTQSTFRGPRGRQLAGGIEHTAPLPRGSSGGPIVDAEGRLLGVNTLRLDGGFILALPADAALKERAAALARGEAPARIRLGLAVAPPHVARRMRQAVGLPPRDGVLVRAVVDDGPAARAGIERGDLIVAAGGREVDSVDALHRTLDERQPGDTLDLTVVRGTEERQVQVELRA